MHLPERVMRQFGMIQHEPPICDTYRSLHGIDRRGRSGTDWSISHADHIAAWNNRRAQVVTADPFIGRIDRTDPYMQWYELITRHPIGPPRDVPPIGSQSVAATKEILVQTAVTATEIAAELFTCTDMDEVHRLATRLRTMGRRSIVALNEEHRLRGDATTYRSDRPCSSDGAGPSHSAPPSISPRDGPSIFTGVAPSTSERPISSPSAPTDLPSIDDYTVITEDVEVSPSHDYFVTPIVQPIGPVPHDQQQHVRMKTARPRYQPEMETIHIQLEDTLSQAQGSDTPGQPTAPPVQPQLEGGRRYPERTKKKN